MAAFTLGRKALYTFQTSYKYRSYSRLDFLSVPHCRARADMWCPVWQDRAGPVKRSHPFHPSFCSFSFCSIDSPLHSSGRYSQVMASLFHLCFVQLLILFNASIVASRALPTSSVYIIYVQEIQVRQTLTSPHLFAKARDTLFAAMSISGTDPDTTVGCHTEYLGRPTAGNYLDYPLDINSNPLKQAFFAAPGTAAGFGLSLYNRGASSDVETFKTGALLTICSAATETKPMSCIQCSATP